MTDPTTARVMPYTVSGRRLLDTLAPAPEDDRRDVLAAVRWDLRDDLAAMIVAIELEKDAAWNPLVGQASNASRVQALRAAIRAIEAMVDEP